MDSFNLTNNFLIAMPTLEDPYFSKALIYVCEHTRNGALGIIVNRPLELNLASLLEKVNITFERQDLADLPVYFGGPVVGGQQRARAGQFALEEVETLRRVGRGPGRR